MPENKIDYKSAGVDIDAGNKAVELIKEKVKNTHSKDVLTGIGSFGSLFSLKNIISDYEDPVMVQSIDGVGTKTIIARKMKKFNLIGAPYKILLGKKSSGNLVEFIETGKDSQNLSLEQIVKFLTEQKEKI